MSYSNVFTMVDIKLGFLNIPVTEQTKQYLGIVMQDGLYVWRQMAVGLLGAPFLLLIYNGRYPFKGPVHG